MKPKRSRRDLFAVLGLVAALPLAAGAQSQYEPYTFSTLPGSITAFPEDVAAYGTNIYFINWNGHVVRQIKPDGTITNIAGLSGSPGTNDGVGTAARFYYPRGVAVNSQGNIYVADTFSHTIRKVTPGGVVTTLAGKAANSGNEDGPPGVARFNYVIGIAADDAGNVYVGDMFRVRKITPTGHVSTLAGWFGTSGGDDGVGSEARFGQYIRGVAVDGNGNVYVTDTDSCTIRKITPSGEVTTLAGLYQTPGSADGIGSEARFDRPEGIGVDASGNVFVADTQNLTIRKITPDGRVTTIAGIPGVFGSSNGSGTNALFGSAIGLAVNSVGSIFVADNSRIRASWKYINSWESDESGKWEDEFHWSVGSPSVDDSVDYITNAVTKLVGIDADTVADWPETLTVNNILISAPGSDINTLALYNAGPATPLVVKDFLILDSRGTVVVTNSAIEVGQGLVVGRTNGNSGLIIWGGGKVVSKIGYVGFVTDTFNNVQVSGAGAAWTNQAALFMGVNSSENSLVVDLGGTVVDEGPVYVGYGGHNNAVAVTNIGSVWRNLSDAVFGYDGGSQNGLYVGNGGKVVNEGYTAVGYASDFNGVVVTDAGSLLQNTGPLVIGDDSGNENFLSVINGATVQVGYANQDSLEIGTGGNGNIVTVYGSGSLLDCSGSIELVWGAPPTFDDFNALLIADGGTVTTPSLVVSNGNVAGLIGGTLNTGETIYHNGLVFSVGTAQSPATLHLNGGEHIFANGLLVTSNAVLTGCGVIRGPVAVMAGGSVQVGAGCSLTFTGSVTNYGSIQTNAGSTLVFQGPLVNNGTIGSAAPPPACATVISGNIVNLADSATYTVTDGTNSAQFNWSLAGPGASGWIYSTFNTHVAIATGVTNINQIFNAANFTFTTSPFSAIGPVKDAAANGGIGQFVVLKRNTGHYAVVRLDDVQANDTLNATWWFQSSGSTNFSCLTPPPPGAPPAVTNLALNAGSGGVSLSFATQPGRTYTVEMRTNLTAGSWTTVTNFLGNGSQRTFLFSVTNRPQGYYRVGVQ